MTEDNHPQTETKKQKAIRMWLDDDDGHLWTDSHIAKRCGASVPFVSSRRRLNTKFAPPAKRKHLNKMGETVWKNIRSKGKKQPPRAITLPEVRGPELITLLSRLRTDAASLSTHKEAGLIIVCAAEEFLDILNAYPPQKKVHRVVDDWSEANEIHEPL